MHTALSVEPVFADRPGSLNPPNKAGLIMTPLRDNIETLKQTCHQEGTLMAPFAFSSLMIH